MVFDNNLKDNLTLMSDENSRYLKPLLILLAGAVLAVIIYYTYSPAKPRPGTADAAAAKKPVASARMDQRALDALNKIMAGNNIVLARQKCYEILQTTANPATAEQVEKTLGQINVDLLFSPRPMPEKIEYIVQSGDSLEKLAKTHGTTVELIRKCNALQGKIIHPGDRLRIFNAKLAITISKSQNNLLLKANGRFFKRYPVGTGKFGTTPVGSFVIADKIIEPLWWRPDGKMIPFGDKENVLGTRWMSLIATGPTAKVRGYGIHGTWEPGTIGKQASAGCVRLVNANVEELYTIVPAGTPVTIAE